MGFIAKPLRVSYETVKDPYFHAKSFKVPWRKKGFSARGSSRASAGRIFKGSVRLKIRSLSILTHF